ncbi:MAG: phosphotransferase family protein [Pyrinomonadaceae bacterium]
MNETRPVREGEEIDRERLCVYLAARLDAPSREIEVTQFPAGSSNLTYLIRLGGAGQTQSDSLRSDDRGRTEFVLRRPPHGNTVRSAHDMRREFDVLSKLSKVYEPAPKSLLFCEDEAVIGSEFYLMERRRGLIIRGKIPGMHDDWPHTPAGTLRSDGLRPNEMCRAFVENLARLHRLDPRQAGLESLGRADGYNRRQVEGWTKRYLAARVSDVPELERAIIWLHGNIPSESGSSLIHNDYKFDNIMLDPLDLTRITAVLDWEMVTIGDPLMDLGTTLGYWMSKDAGDEMLGMPFNPRVLMENVSRQELVEIYATSCGRPLPDMLFYYVFGTFKIAVIAQQIYARFVNGSTRDPRFARFDQFVAALGRISNSAIESEQI